MDLTQHFALPLNVLLAGVILGVIIFAIRKYRAKTSVQDEFKWSISCENINIKSKVKHGEGLQMLKLQEFKSLAYLCITQKSMNIIEKMTEWNLEGLKRLYLRDNNIQSIQQISQILMPNLEVLVLSDNKITTLKSLRRLPTLNLIWFQVQNNLLYQNLDVLSQMSLANLHYMWVQFFGNDTHFNDDLTWLSKCQSIILTKFYSFNDKRIIVPNFISAMKRKYLNFDIKINTV